jgi:uncharacterized membrane protein
MSRLVVLAFNNKAGSEGMHHALTRLRRQHLVQLAEPAMVVRAQDGEVTVMPAIGLVWPAVLLGSFWGLMVGLLFSAPWLGLGIGAVGAIISALADTGAEDEFIRHVGSSIEPGHSALLLLAHDWADDRTLESEITRFDGVILPPPGDRWRGRRRSLPATADR